ncbi:FAD binding domain-containing protein [Aquabacterium sp. J223]|uniref:FAD binding domain-containing protein n=1 Tax=Aquabacterium sp. J223 TaxID=2898431 RepID=UPI0021ADE1CF|nr:FAD binding domain-containing protein [Aquabacterium sp. J223]UUX96448.1 FAD binding domain-containing protein [Aquabacterium sp. J223]
MKPAPFAYHAAQDLPQALALLAEADGLAKPVGGTQSLGPMLNLRLAQPPLLVDLSRLPALRGAALRGDALRIGAAVTHARLEDGELPDVTRGLLPHVAAGIAYRAVRNRGTLGGSLAHADPAADWVSTMALLDATLVLAGPGGERTLRAGDFFLGAFTTALAPDEVLAAVEVPCFSPAARWAYRKVCRKPGEFAEALAAAWLDASRGIARVVLGALPGMPQVVAGDDALALLREPSRADALLDAAGVDDDVDRQRHRTLLRRLGVELSIA